MQESRDRWSLNVALSRLLLAGVLISIVLLLLAASLSLVDEGGLPRQMPPVGQSLAGVSQLEPTGILGLGILALLLTPIAGVVVAAFGFARQRDWFYAAIAVLVLAILAFSVMLAR